MKGRFDDVELHPKEDQMMKFRRQLADQVEGAAEAFELSTETTTISEFLDILRGLDKLEIGG